MTNDISSSFSPVTDEQWKNAVQRELKDLQFEDILIRKDEVENLEFEKYGSLESQPETVESASWKSNNNDWEINHRIVVKDEKVANKEALQVLNLGASSLTFELKKNQISWAALFEGIGLDHIETQFHCMDQNQEADLAGQWSNFCKKELQLLNATLSSENKNLSVLSYEVQQAGANAIQEIAYALAIGNEGLTQTKNTLQSITFEMGIGANYFVEITKFRAIQSLWNFIRKEQGSTCNSSIIARTTFVNKSLKDPYTNLLRQTTEAMSAVLGGAQAVDVQPYDLYSLEADREFSSRMAINISNLLKEESYLQYVIDPLKGSYNMEALTKQLKEKAWALFLEIEKAGGISSDKGLNHLKGQIEATREVRINRAKEGKSILIGVNKFANPDEKSASWSDIESRTGFSALILEKEI